MAETMCPKCGLSPLPVSASKCPRCGEEFGAGTTVTRSRMSLTGTLMGGGLRGEVSAHPGTFATALALCGVIWLLRASGLIVDVGDPPWLLALAAFQLGGAALLMARYHPARRIAQVLAGLQLFVCLVMGNPMAVFNLLGAALSVVLLFMLLGEPATWRRYLGLVGVAGLAAGEVTALFVKADAPAAAMLEVRDEVTKVSLKAPHEWLAMTPEEVRGDLDVPDESGKTKYLPFGDEKNHIYGVLIVSRDEEQINAGCPWQIKRLGGVTDATPLSLPAPGALAEGGLLFDLRTRSGASGRIACSVAHGRLTALAVVARERTGNVGAKFFEQLAQTVKTE
ncbi:MAG: hypothetical protein QM723_39685 [Myxococcaceae bacterium]